MSAGDEVEVRREIVNRLHSELMPLVRVDKHLGGYDCCGCSTYEAIVLHAIRIANGSEAVPASDNG